MLSAMMHHIPANEILREAKDDKRIVKKLLTGHTVYSALKKCRQKIVSFTSFRSHESIR